MSATGLSRVRALGATGPERRGPAADSDEISDSGDAAVVASKPARRYIRSASLFAHAADLLPGQPLTGRPQLALHDLQLLDGALAEAAHFVGIPVAALDTTATSRDVAPPYLSGCRSLTECFVVLAG